MNEETAINSRLGLFDAVQQSPVGVTGEKISGDFGCVGTVEEIVGLYITSYFLNYDVV